jgi:hypothetical protein
MEPAKGSGDEQVNCETPAPQDKSPGWIAPDLYRGYATKTVPEVHFCAQTGRRQAWHLGGAHPSNQSKASIIHASSSKIQGGGRACQVVADGCSKVHKLPRSEAAERRSTPERAGCAVFELPLAPWHHLASSKSPRGEEFTHVSESCSNNREGGSMRGPGTL